MFIQFLTLLHVTITIRDFISQQFHLPICRSRNDTILTACNVDAQRIRKKNYQLKYSMN